MKLLKLIIFISAATYIFLILAKTTHASEGTFELRSTNNQNYRCFAASLLMQNSRFKIIVSCRDLIYPPQPDLFTYILWASPTSGNRPIKLGELGVGKANFEIGDSFSTLYVTIEQNLGIRSPSNQVVMRGGLQKITFLDRPTTPTPTPEGMEEEIEQVEETAELSTREKLASAIKRAGIVALLGIVALIGLIFVLTRPK